MGRTIFLLITQVSVLLKLWNFQSLAISQRLEAYSAHYRRKRLVGHFVCLLRCVKEGKLKITVPSLLITFFCCCHCYLFKKRGKGKQFIWTLQYVIVETLTDRMSIMKNDITTHLNHPSTFRHWACSTLPTLSMPPKMKISAVRCRRRRKKKREPRLNT